MPPSSGTHNFVANGIVAHNSLEQDADVVMFLYRDEVYNNESPDKGSAEVIVAKHRSGPIGTKRLVFLGQYTALRQRRPRRLIARQTNRRSTPQIVVDWPTRVRSVATRSMASMPSPCAGRHEAHGVIDLQLPPPGLHRRRIVGGDVDAGDRCGHGRLGVGPPWPGPWPRSRRLRLVDRDDGATDVARVEVAAADPPAASASNTMRTPAAVTRSTRRSRSSHSKIAM